MNKSEVKKIFFESSIWSVLETFEGGFDRPIKAKQIATFAFVASVVLVFGIQKHGVSTNLIFDWLEKIVDISLLFASSLFGVSVAAFAIFSSSLDRDLTEKLIERNHYGSVSILNFLFSVFAYTMVTLFGVIFVSIFFMLFFWRDSLFVQALGFSDNLRRCAVLLFIPIYIAQLAFAISILFSFIWNFHTLLLTMAGLKVVK